MNNGGLLSWNLWSSKYQIFLDKLTQAECKDKDTKFCESYVRIYAKFNHKICEKYWFVSRVGKYGCEKSCKLCTPAKTVHPETCKDKNEKHCASYVRKYAKSRYKICDKDWFVSDGGRYGCKKSCKLCTSTKNKTSSDTVKTKGYRKNS